MDTLQVEHPGRFYIEDVSLDKPPMVMVVVVVLMVLILVR